MTNAQPDPEGLKKAIAGCFKFPAANDNKPQSKRLEGDPVDVWARASSPQLPENLLPAVISELAIEQAGLMGVDAGGLAMAAITVCAAAIPDSIKIQPKQYDESWTESARIWTALIGAPSAKKSPVINEATRPLRAIDRTLFQQYTAAKMAYDALDKDQRKATEAPRHTRIRLEDTTIEAAQEVLKDSPDGVLLVQDELSGWFGSMDKYSGGGRGSQKDRAFWLQAFNGGNYTVNRVGRGSTWIDNLSVSLIGGIQPDLIRAMAKDSHDDGLLQRLFPIVLQPAQMGKDAPTPPVVAKYGHLIERLTMLRRPLRGGMMEVPIRFTTSAQQVWQEVMQRNYDLVAHWEGVNKKLSSAIGKYDGLFARLCLTWHCIESAGDRPASVIDFDVADRVRTFLYDFLYPHAIAFYTDIMGMSDRHDAVLATAGWILTHRPQIVTVRSIQRGDATMRQLERDAVEATLQKLDAFGWLNPVPQMRKDSISYMVHPRVYEVFERKAIEETKRRAAIRETIAQSLGNPT